MAGSDGQLWRHSTAPATNKSGQPDPLSTALHEESFVSEFAAVTTLHPDIRRGRRPPEPRGYGLRGCYASRLLQRPSPRRPRKRSLPRLARSHSPNPHLRRWIFPANLPIAVPGSAYVLQEQMPRFRLFAFPLERVSRGYPWSSRRGTSCWRGPSFSPPPFSMRASSSNSSSWLSF